MSERQNKTIAEVLEERKYQSININELDDLMLVSEIKTIGRQGIRFLGTDYFDERLYGLKSKVLIKYSLFDLKHIKVFTVKGEFLCKAECVTETHPMARVLGDVHDLEDFKQKIEKQKRLKRKTLTEIKKYLPVEEVKFIETQIIEEINPKVESFKPRLINNKPLFKNNLEKYDWLVENEAENLWIKEFQATKEYKLFYGDEK